jgi:hypothetical protein
MPQHTVPHLDLSQILNVFMMNNIPNLQDVQPPATPRPSVNRWHTPVSIHVYIRARIHHVKWFGDLQEAYLFAKGLVEQYRDEDVHQLFPWTLQTFDYTATRLEYLWNTAGDGMVLAECEMTNSRIETFYEPEETENIQQILDQQRRINQGQ